MVLPHSLSDTVGTCPRCWLPVLGVLPVWGGCGRVRVDSADVDASCLTCCGFGVLGPMLGGGCSSETSESLLVNKSITSVGLPLFLLGAIGLLWEGGVPILAVVLVSGTAGWLMLLLPLWLPG